MNMRNFVEKFYIKDISSYITAMLVGAMLGLAICKFVA